MEKVQGIARRYVSDDQALGHRDACMPCPTHAMYTSMRSACNRNVLVSARVIESRNGLDVCRVTFALRL